MFNVIFSLAIYFNPPRPIDTSKPVDWALIYIYDHTSAITSFSLSKFTPMMSVICLVRPLLQRMAANKR